MSTINTSETIGHNRRNFLRQTALTLAAAPLAVTFAGPQSTQSPLPPIRPGTNTSFGPLKQINAGLLNVDTRRPDPPMDQWPFCFTDGPTTFTALSMSRRCWHRQATA